MSYCFVVDVLNKVVKSQAEEKGFKGLVKPSRESELCVVFKE